MNDFSIDSFYVILINDDNSMVTTRKRKIMQNSNLVDILCFLIHPDYAENDMENFSVSLHYYLPVSAVEVVEILALSDDTYDGYLLYKLPIDTELTTESGDVHLSLTFSHKDIDENGDEVTRIRKVSGAKLRIEGSSPIKPVPDEYKRQVLFVNALPAIGDRECVYVYMDEFYLWNGSEYICTTDDSDDFPISGWEPNKQLITDENGNLALGDINGINISSSAREGQTIIVKKTDGHGNPVEWECADTSIFGSKSEFVIQVDEPEDTSVLWLDLDDESDHAENIDLTGYATEKYVQNYAQPKGNYLTEHQDISGKLDTSALPTAIDSALAKAKASGEFDGRDGVDGKDGSDGRDGYTPQKGVDYFDGQPGKDGKDGKDGQDYVLTEADKNEIAEIAAELVDVPESDGDSRFVVQSTAPEDTSVLWVDPTDEGEDSPGEEAYELIQSVTVEEEGITSVTVKKFPDGKSLSLNKAFATLKFPLLESDITTGSLEFNIGSETERVYSSYSPSLELKPNSLGRHFQMTLWVEIDGGVLVGESNMSVTLQLESSRRVVGPVAVYMGNRTINNVSAFVANGIPVGSVFELYGVRA